VNFSNSSPNRPPFPLARNAEFEGCGKDGTEALTGHYAGHQGPERTIRLRLTVSAMQLLASINGAHTGPGST